MSKTYKQNVYYFQDEMRKVPASSRNIASQQPILTILKDHEMDLRHFLNARLAGHPDKEDLMQDIFVRLAEQEDLPKRLSLGYEKTRAYLIIIASNLIRDMYRRRQVREKARQDILYEQQLSIEKRTLEKQQAARQKLAAIDTVLAELSPKCRQAFKLSRFENLGYREIGEKMNISASMVRKYVAKALLTLKTEVDISGGEL